MKIQIEVSAKHIHLSQGHLEALFGNDYKLNIKKELSQPGAFAAEEKVKIKGNKGQDLNLRVVGPCREKTQIEISMTEAFKLGIDAPVRESGNVEGSASAILEGPAGEVDLNEGVIIAKRHIHTNNEHAEKNGLKSGENVSIKVGGERGVIFENVLVRVSEKYGFSMHIDTDEGNSAGIPKGGEGELVK